MTGIHIDYYIVDVEYEYEHTVRDEFGWIEGHGPGCGNFKPSKKTVRIQAPNESYAKLWVEYYFSVYDIRNLTINKITKETLHLDAVITVKQ